MALTEVRPHLVALDLTLPVVPVRWRTEASLERGREDDVVSALLVH